MKPRRDIAPVTGAASPIAPESPSLWGVECVCQEQVLSIGCCAQSDSTERTTNGLLPFAVPELSFLLSEAVLQSRDETRYTVGTTQDDSFCRCVGHGARRSLPPMTLSSRAHESTAVPAGNTPITTKNAKLQPSRCEAPTILCD